MTKLLDSTICLLVFLAFILFLSVFASAHFSIEVSADTYGYVKRPGAFKQTKPQDQNLNYVKGSY